MDKIEQAREVALDMRDVYADPLSLPIRAADTIDALIEELAALKRQKPVMQHCPNCNHEQTALSVDCGNCGNVYDAAPLFLSVGAQSSPSVTKDSIRAAGGIVHSDGNVFFTNIDQIKAMLAAPAQAQEDVTETAFGNMAQERKPLTDKEIDTLMIGTSGSPHPFYRAMARAVEAAHGIGEQP